MKRTYERPLMTAELFEANEYVAACYALACKVGNGVTAPYGNKWSAPEKGSGGHAPEGTSGTCGDKLSNRLLTTDAGALTDVQENNGEQGWISGKVDYWSDEDGSGTYNGGDVIYWYTSGSDNRRWNHWGVLENVDESHPNHS